jgi:serine/threonine protein kinase/WD40 repeat protein
MAISDPAPEKFPRGPWDAEWHLIAKLGDGGSGDVYKARAKDETGRLAAVKILKGSLDPIRAEERRQRMAKEADVLRRIAIPGVPGLLDTNCGGPSPGRLFIAMEFVEGPTLEAHVHDHGPLSIEDSVALVDSLVQTIDQVHRINVGHRDIKDDNIVLRDGDIRRPVLVDFGQSFHIAESDGATTNDQQMGNRFLHLPELLAGPKRDKRSDLTQCCAVLFYTLTAVVPDAIEDGAGLKPHERVQAVKALSALSEPFRSRLIYLLSRAFSPPLRDRWQTAEELRRHLHWILSPSPPGIPVSVYAATIRARGLLRRPMRLVALTLAALSTMPFVAYERSVAREASEQARVKALLDAANTAISQDPTKSLAILKTVPALAEYEGAIRVIGESAARNGVAWRVVPRNPESGSEGSVTIAADPSGRSVALYDQFGTASKRLDLVTGAVTVEPDTSAVLFVGSSSITGHADGTVEIIEGGKVTSRTRVGRGVAGIYPLTQSAYLLVDIATECRLWRPGQGSLQRLSPPAGEIVSKIRVLGPEGIIIWGTRTGKVYVSSMDGEPRSVVDLGEEILGVKTTESTNSFVAWTHSGRIGTWDVRGRSSVWSIGGAKIRDAVSLDGTATWITNDGNVSMRNEASRDVRTVFSIGRPIGLLDAVTISNSGNYVFVSNGAAGQIWSQDGNAILTTRGHTQSIDRAAFTLDDKLLVTATWGREARVWKIPEERDRVLSLTSDITNVKLAPNAKSIAIGTGAGPVIWNLADRPWSPGKSESGDVVIGGWSADSRQIIYAQNQTLRLWSPADEPEVILREMAANVSTLHADQSLQMVWWTDWAFKAWLWNRPEAPKPLALPEGFKATAVERVGKGVVVGGLDGAMVVIADGATQSREVARHKAQVMWLSVSPDGGSVVSQSRDGEIRLWTSEMRDYKCLTTTAQERFRFSPEGRLTWPERDRTARILFDGKVATLGAGERSYGTSVAVDDKRMLAAIGGQYGVIAIRDLRMGFMREIFGHRFDVYGPLFADGQVITFGMDKRVVAWHEFLPPEVDDVGRALRELTNAVFDFESTNVLAGARD